VQSVRSLRIRMFIHNNVSNPDVCFQYWYRSVLEQYLPVPYIIFILLRNSSAASHNHKEPRHFPRPKAGATKHITVIYLLIFALCKPKDRSPSHILPCRMVRPHSTGLSISYVTMPVQCTAGEADFWIFFYIFNCYR
jgi:hypothetical protein